MNIRLIYIWVFVSVCHIVYAQSLDSITHIDTIFVVENGNKDVINVDRADDIIDVLNSNSTYYIKNYGPGQLSTLGVRGSTAGQNSVFWNGVEISSPMLGLIDLSQLSYGGYNQVSISPFGEGQTGNSIGGRLKLVTQIDSSYQHAVDGDLYIGSYSDYRANASYFYGGDHYNSSTNLHFGKSINNFDFKDNFGNRKKMSHSEKNEWNFSHGQSWKFSDRGALETHIWARGQDVNIGPAIHQRTSGAEQRDNNYRGIMILRNKYRSLNYKVHAAILHDYIRYKDSLTNTDDSAESTVYTLKLSVSDSYKFIHFSSGIDSRISYAVSDNYIGRKSQNIHSLFFGAEKLWGNQEVRFLLNQYVFDNKLLVPTFRLNYGAHLNDHLYVGAKVARAIRIPSLNDLNWKEGGNGELRPEKAWKNELNARYKKNIGNLSIISSLSIFNNWTSDWILWRPVSATTWSPINIHKVWSRGLNPKTLFEWRNTSEFSAFFSLSYEWVKATYQNKLSQNDGSKGRQLLYTPEHSGYLGIGGSYKSWNIASALTYKSRSFTTRDNEVYLPKYLLLDINVNKRSNLFGVAINTEFGIRNIGNTSYQIISSRPMPLRNYYLKLNFKLN